ncbi:MAG: hypothetical protein E7269_07780 [Lachnospiraceae bacterium]|nr:hypothetical protein [Lachnospiraceae bacterium]
MNYIQMTLDDWVNMKEQLKKELIGASESFVRIGYILRKIEEQHLYEQDGYASIADFAKAEYGLSASAVSRFIGINKKYSINGNSDQLCPEYALMGSSKLSEMLTLPDHDLEMIQPQATKENIRELKRFNSASPVAGVADDIRQLIEQFYRENQNELNEVFREQVVAVVHKKRFVEIINPSGNRSFKKGMYFLMMYENRIVAKKFGSNPQEMTWEEFINITNEIFGAAADGANTWRHYFGESETPVEETTEEPKKEEKAKPTSESQKEEKKPKAEPTQEPVAPAQIPPEEQPTETDIQPAERVEGEVEEKKFTSRKAYLDSLTEYGMAEYFAKIMPTIDPALHGNREYWEKWLNEEVDDSGNTWEAEENREVKNPEKIPPIKRGCITGLNPYGTCACCGNNETVECCSQCREDCNCRCGWLKTENKQKEELPT